LNAEQLRKNQNTMPLQTTSGKLLVIDVTSRVTGLREEI
jgi:hypothetical protein